MPTYNQLVKGARKKKKATLKSKKILYYKPLIRATIKRITTVSPKKPNSANRCIAKVITSNNIHTTVYIPGEKHSLQEHSVILVKGGGAQDLPAVRLSAVRGVYDLEGVKGRKSARSVYGTKKD